MFLKKKIVILYEEMGMNKQKILIGIILILVSVGLSGCSEQDQAINQSQEQSNPPGTESLFTILEKAQNIESLYYEITATINMSVIGTQTAIIKIWQKKPYLKEEITSTAAGMTSTISVIHRPDGNYTYDTNQGKYVVTTETTSFAANLEYLDSDMIKKYLDNQTITNLQTEIIDGKQASIIEYNLPQEMNEITIKIWIWNENGLPLRAYMNMILEETTMTMDLTFTNYSFSEIPDSTFNV